MSAARDRRVEKKLGKTVKSNPLPPFQRALVVTSLPTVARAPSPERRRAQPFGCLRRPARRPLRLIGVFRKPPEKRLPKTLQNKDVALQNRDVPKPLLFGTRQGMNQARNSKRGAGHVQRTETRCGLPEGFDR